MPVCLFVALGAELLLQDFFLLAVAKLWFFLAAFS
jgi:hypothetical protein